MKLLLTGGAGYVGSAVMRVLRERGHACTVLDDLSRGHRAAAAGAELVVGSYLDAELLGDLLEEGQFDAVLHFAALSLVGESMQNAGLYWRANVAGGVGLLEAMRRCGPKRIVFSSSAAVYGAPLDDIISEEHRTAPCNPYGRTKRVFEWALEDYAHVHGFAVASLRYFNAAGADPDGTWGEDHQPETHLIPLVLGAALDGDREVEIFGDDWPTRDGTCVRDFVHVLDLGQAHALALERVIEGRQLVFNLGSSRGATVREVIETARLVTGRAIRTRVGPRRAGDPATLVASSRRATEELGWSAAYGDLEVILRHAWSWHSAHPGGYEDA